MEKILRGKYLVRKAKLENNKEEVVIICGVFYPTNFNIKDINDKDEMWVSDIMVSSDGVRFTDSINGGYSIEDFINGTSQSSSDWKTKGRL